MDEDWRQHYEWDYYSESRPRKAVGGIKTRRDRGTIGDTWWSRRWVRALEVLGMGTRLTRGRIYARQGQVLSIDVQAGLVKAQVQGSRLKPYEITIRLHPFSDHDWENVADVMVKQAILAAKLLAGEMPTDIEDAFDAAHLALFPTTTSDLETSCSCPDWVTPCKHIAAVYYILAERFDEDPFLLFKLRGRSKEALVEMLRQKRSASAPSEEQRVSAKVVHQAEPRIEQSVLRLEDSLETFWQAGDGLQSFEVQPQLPSIDKAVLKRLGSAPFTLGEENVTTVLSRAYDQVNAAAARKIEELQAADQDL